MVQPTEKYTVIAKSVVSIQINFQLDKSDNSVLKLEKDIIVAFERRT